jgi:Phage integrase, N-terminal SAM-like domain
VNENRVAAAAMAVRRYYEKWIETRRLPVRRAQFRDTRRHIENYVLPRLGDLPLSELSPDRHPRFPGRAPRPRLGEDGPEYLDRLLPRDAAYRREDGFLSLAAVFPPLGHLRLFRSSPLDGSGRSEAKRRGRLSLPSRPRARRLKSSAHGSDSGDRVHGRVAAVGDQIEATVTDDGSRSGSVVLKRTLGRGGRVPGELEQALEYWIAVEGVVSGQNKGGFDVQVARAASVLPCRADRRPPKRPGAVCWTAPGDPVMASRDSRALERRTLRLRRDCASGR